MTNERAALAAHLEKLGDAVVVVVGDIMLDRYIYGAAARLSPEAPVPVLKIEREAEMLGGAGNVARNLSALGATTRLVAVVGDDDAGRRVGTFVGALEGAKAELVIDPDRPTSRKDRFVAGAQQLLRTDWEMTVPVTGGLADDLVARAGAALSGAGAMILSDYDKGVLTPAVIERLVALAADARVPVFVDPKGHDYERYAGAAMVTPNRAELTEATGLPTGTDAEVAVAARRLIGEAGVHRVLATRGPAGMSLLDADGALHHIPAEAREVFDVSGAGDTVIATAAAAVAAGLGWLAAVQIANVAAGVVVAKAGTAVARPDEIAAEILHQDLAAAEAKLVRGEVLADRLAGWRARDLKVGFTNGCFDLLHPGHVHLLAQARRACDRLIVGLNSDASVQRLKGPERPVQTEAARAAVLGALSAVDLVVLFEEDTPEALIREIRPDVLIKGADYTVETVVGAEFVQSYGGTVVLADLMDGHSTTATIGRLRGG